MEYGSTEYWRKCCMAAEKQAERERKEFDRYMELYRRGQFKNDKNTEAAEMNLVFMYLTMVSASLFAQAPSIEVEAQDGGGVEAFAPVAQAFGGDPAAARQAFADGFEQLLQRSAEEGEYNEAANATIQYALLTGLGWSLVTFDPVRGLPAIDAERRDKIYVDPCARYSLRQADYYIHTVEKRYDEAVEFFNAMGVQIGAPNWQLGEGEGYAATQRMGEGRDATRDQFKYYAIWCKGRPGSGDRVPGSENGTIKYLPYNSPDLLTETAWPFTLPDGDFNIVPLAFNRQYLQVSDAFTELQSTEGLRKIINEATEFFRRQTQRGLGKVLVLNKEYFDEAAQTEIQGGKDFSVILGQKTGAPQEMYSLIDFNSANDPTPEKAAKFKEYWEQVLGLDQLMSGANVRGMTATEADQRAESSNIRNSRRQGFVDTWQTKLAQTSAQVVRQLTPPEIAGQLVDERFGLLFSLYDGDAAKFGREYAVNVAAGSTGERHRQQRIQRLKDFATMAAGANQAQPLGPQFNLHEIALEIGQAENIRRPEKFVLPPQPVAAAVPGPGGMSATAAPGQAQQSLGVPGGAPRA